MLTSRSSSGSLAIQTKRPLPRYISDPEQPLLQLSSHRDDSWSLRHATEGVHITGSIGSGKSSGPGAAIAEAYLRAGMGGIVLTAKPGEFELWQGYAARAGRLEQLIRFAPDAPFAFNFLDYAIKADEAAGRRFTTMNVVNLLMKVTEAAQRGNEMSGKAAEQPFWRLAPRELLDHTIDVLYAAYGTLRLADIPRFILDAPRSEEDYDDDAFKRSSFFMQTLAKMIRDPVHLMSDADEEVVLHYFRRNFGRLDERTRSNIVATMTSQLAPLLKGVMREKFCEHTLLVPELTHAGAIIVLDFPVTVYHEAGFLAQHIFKYLWQKATESRNARANDRPVFCWGDEAQYFITPHDIPFLTTARSQRACMVYLTQTISNYHATIGGSDPRAATKAFLASFVTKIFLRNDDSDTNQAAADYVGRRVQIRLSSSSGQGGGSTTSFGETEGISFQSGGQWSSTRQAGGVESYSSGGSVSSGTSKGTSYSESLAGNWSEGLSRSEMIDYDIQPAEFAGLRTGPTNGWHTDALLFQAGRTFRANRGRNYLTVSFPQRG